MTTQAAKFPAALAANTDLYADTSAAGPLTLNGPHSNVVATLTTNEAVPASWPTQGTVLVDSELILYTGKGATSLTGCTRGTQITFGAGAAASHNGGASVYLVLPPQQYAQAAAEIVNIEKALASQGTIASAATTDMSTTTSQYVQVTGTTTITAFGTMPAGTIRIMEFAGALTITHNATTLILRSGGNATTAAGDVYAFASEGSGNWRELWHNTLSNGGVITATMNNYAQPINSTAYYGVGAIGATDLPARMVMPRAGTISRLYIVTSTSQPGVGSFVLTLMKNGVAQTVTTTVPINGAAGVYSDTTNSFAVAAGDEVNIRGVNNDTGSAAAQFRSFAFQIA